MAMRYGVLADVHGNLPALEAVLAHLERERVDRYLCAGDLVGYGPYPNECVALIRDIGACCVAGNHDLMVLSRLREDGCIPLARTAVAWTRVVLDGSSLRYLAGLPLTAAAPDGVVLAHGSLDDPQEYTLDGRQAARQLASLATSHPDTRVLVLGHTHLPRGWESTGAALRPDAAGVVALPPREGIVLNPGAVGQSRERRLHARCMLLDLDRDVATFYALPYDAGRTRRQLGHAGLSARSLHLRPSPVRTAFRRPRHLARRVRRIRLGASGD
jgi:predicted phosphodiesterase